MSRLLAVCRREMLAYFFSPLGYVLIAAFVAVAGLAFWVLSQGMSDPRNAPIPNPLSEYYFQFLLWILTLILPGVTMRLISEELRSGSVELLLTTPVREGEVVVGKFLGAVLFYAALLASTLPFVGLAAHFSEPALDFGPVWSGYLGLFAIGSMLIAIGLFISAFCKNQIVAFVLSLLAVFGFQLLPAIASATVGGSGVLATVGSVATYIAFGEHFRDLGRGIVDLRHFVVYGTFTAGFLFATTLVLALRKAR